MTITKTLPVVVIAVGLLTAPAAMAMNYGHDYSRYNRDNCLFKSSMTQKGGEHTRTGIYDSTSTDAKKYCMPTNVKWRGVHADAYYKNAREDSYRTRVDENGRVVRY